jgi:hypothetical protein
MDQAEVQQAVQVQNEQDKPALAQQQQLEKEKERQLVVVREKVVLHLVDQVQQKEI